MQLRITEDINIYQSYKKTKPFSQYYTTKIQPFFQQEKKNSKFTF